MLKEKEPHFFKGSPIHLGNGAVVTPIIRNKKSKKADKLISFLQGARWIRCLHQKDCINATQSYDGFSCENCPLKGKLEHTFAFNKARATQDALQCAELLLEAFKGGLA
ncbi:MAG: hypothetical protein QG620_37 [Patescibacteria group bacterium]|nr:hypothetical protein [Patescibacteria group bacterium]